MENKEFKPKAKGKLVKVERVDVPLNQAAVMAVAEGGGGQRVRKPVRSPRRTMRQ